MSEENDKATEAENAGKAALEEQKAKDAEKMAAIEEGKPTEAENEARKDADEAATAANEKADDAAEDAYQEQMKKEQEGREAILEAEEAADDAAEKAFQEEAKKEQEARQAALEAEQQAYEDEIAAAKEAAEKERREEEGDFRTDEEVAEDEAAAAKEQEELYKSLSEDQQEDQSLEADEEEIGFEETTAVEDLEQAWDESGVMGVYSSRTDLFNKFTSNWFSWFPPVRRFPEINFNFIVMAGLDFLGEFKSVSGIGKSLPAFEVEEGGRHHSPHYLPFKGPASREQLKLEWGSVSATSLYEWIQAVRIGWAFHRDVIVVQLSRDGWPTRIMRFGNCWPTAWSGADLDTGGSSWALQSLSLVYDDFNMITIPFDLGAWSRSE